MNCWIRFHTRDEVCRFLFSVRAKKFRNMIFSSFMCMPCAGLYAATHSHYGYTHFSLMYVFIAPSLSLSPTLSLAFSSSFRCFLDRKESSRLRIVIPKSMNPKQCLSMQNMTKLKLIEAIFHLFHLL